MTAVSSSQFGDAADWSRPQALSNPFDTDYGWNRDRGIQTGKDRPQFEGVDSPLPWREGANSAQSRVTAWQTPSGHQVPLPWSNQSSGSLLMGGIGSS